MTGVKTQQMKSIAGIAVVAIATHGQGRELQERPCAHEPSLVGLPVS